MSNDFDTAALHYDDVFTNSKIGKAQRDMVYSYLQSIFKTSQKLAILELNCGTGEDAINFAQNGHNVIATDISEKMIAIANAKKSPNSLVFKTLDINLLSAQSFASKFDLIFSNFGGLNCLNSSQLNSFIQKASKLLSPDGKLIFVIMPKYCLWERFYFFIKGASQKATRRNTSKAVLANVDGIQVPTWYYNPKDIISFAKEDYTINQIRPIGLCIPPSYLEASFISSTPLLHIFKNLDRYLKYTALAKYADHFLIELQKK